MLIWASFPSGSWGPERKWVNVSWKLRDKTGLRPWHLKEWSLSELEETSQSPRDQCYFLDQDTWVAERGSKLATACMVGVGPVLRLPDIPARRLFYTMKVWIKTRDPLWKRWSLPGGRGEGGRSWWPAAHHLHLLRACYLLIESLPVCKTERIYLVALGCQPGFRESMAKERGYVLDSKGLSLRPSSVLSDLITPPSHFHTASVILDGRTSISNLPLHCWPLL